MADPREGHRARLRARFDAAGLGAFQDYEALELLLGFAVPRVDVKPAAKALVARFGSFAAVLDAPKAALTEVDGVGPQAAALLKAVRAAFERYSREHLADTDALDCPEAVAEYCRASLQGERNEVFQVLYLSTKNRVVATERLSTGTIDRAAVYPRRVIEGALKHNAASLIFVHNHPSGDPTPSPDDVRLTREIAAAARPMGIAVHDHIIVGRGRHTSLRETGRL